MNDIKMKLFDLISEHYILILAFIAFMAVMHWSRLKDSGPQILKFVRKLSLFVFSITFFVPYIKFTSRLNGYLISNYDLNYRFSAFMNEYKGSDWADGLLTSGAFFIYLGILAYLWMLEKKASAPPPEKPFKIEAKIGNIDPPKK
jgi:hypothetical protein